MPDEGFQQAQSNNLHEIVAFMLLAQTKILLVPKSKRLEWLGN